MVVQQGGGQVRGGTGLRAESEAPSLKHRPQNFCGRLAGLTRRAAAAARVASELERQLEELERERARPPRG